MSPIADDPYDPKADLLGLLKAVASRVDEIAEEAPRLVAGHISEGLTVPQPVKHGADLLKDRQAYLLQHIKGVEEDVENLFNEPAVKAFAGWRREELKSSTGQ